MPVWRALLRESATIYDPSLRGAIDATFFNHDGLAVDVDLVRNKCDLVDLAKRRLDAAELLEQEFDRADTS